MNIDDDDDDIRYQHHYLFLLYHSAIKMVVLTIENLPPRCWWHYRHFLLQQSPVLLQVWLDLAVLNSQNDSSFCSWDENHMYLPICAYVLFVHITYVYYVAVMWDILWLYKLQNILLLTLSNMRRCLSSSPTVWFLLLDNFNVDWNGDNMNAANGWCRGSTTSLKCIFFLWRLFWFFSASSNHNFAVHAKRISEEIRSLSLLVQPLDIAMIKRG